MTSLMNLKKFVSEPRSRLCERSEAIQSPRSSGFTLLELLIVIAIIAILSIALVFMLNPAETLKKARDAQRISDLKTVKTALGVFLTSASSTQLTLDNYTGTTAGASTTCLTFTNGAADTVAGANGAKIAYSAVTSGGAAPTVASTTPGTDGATTITPLFGGTGYYSGTPGKVDGSGWIPVNLKSLTSGTPISSFPTDPVNTVSTTATYTDLVYRYACQNGSGNSGKPSYIFEIDARLESNAYTIEDNKMKNDGGDNDAFYETGNSLNLLPAGIPAAVASF